MLKYSIATELRDKFFVPYISLHVAAHQIMPQVKGLELNKLHILCHVSVYCVMSDV
jgi:hypothetical protein